MSCGLIGVAVCFLFWSHFYIFPARGELSFSLGQFGKPPSELQSNDHRKIRHISLAPGHTYLIRCSLSSNDFEDQFPYFPWTRNQINIDEGKIEDATGFNPQAFFDVTDANDRDLYLYEFNESLSGQYSCHSTKENESIVITAKNPAVVFDKIHFDRIRQTSEPLLTNLLLYGDPTPTLANVTWFFNGEPLDATYSDIRFQDAGLKAVYFSFPSGIKRKHTGIYTAIVSTSAGFSNDSFMLQVFTSIIIKFSSDCNCLLNNKITIVENSTFTLSCQDENSNINPSTIFTWFKDGRKDPEDTLIPNSYISKESVSPTENRLVFRNILPKHAGVYYCKANNSIMKDMRGIIISVQYPPKVTAISPSSLTVLIGHEIQLLVKYTEGFPMSQANWSHYNGFKRVCISENERISLLGVSLIISNATINDSGLFILQVGNTVKTIRLDFNISVLAPPTLIRVSNSTVYSLIGSTATFRVGVANSYPSVSIDDIVWSGNFDSCQQKVTFENTVAKLSLTDLKLTNSGSVTLTVNHPSGITMLSFELIVLAIPEVPSSAQIVPITACMVEISWKIPKPMATIAPIDKIVIEFQPCSLENGLCEAEYSLARVCPSNVQSTTLSLLPNKNYYFRLTSCNDLVGCGRSLVLNRKINSNLQERTLEVTTLSTIPINSSAIQLTWEETRLSLECYKLAWHTVKCWNTVGGHKQETTNLSSAFWSSGTYTTILTQLQADSEYNCSVVPVYNDMFGNEVSINTRLAYDTGYTYPRVPTIHLFEIEIDTAANWIESGFIMLNNLNILVEGSDAISHIQIVVLRLGNSPLRPSESPDDLYASMANFSTYELVHLEGQVKDNYQPYVAAELDVQHLPNQFSVGGGHGVEDLIEGQFFNGPLDTSNYYTIFIRFYAWSQFGRQYNVFISSNFSSSVKPATVGIARSSSNGKDGGGTSASAVAVGVSLSLIVIILIFSVSLTVLIKVAHARKRSKGNLMLTGHEPVRNNTPS